MTTHLVWLHIVFYSSCVVVLSCPCCAIASADSPYECQVQEERIEFFNEKIIERLADEDYDDLVKEWNKVYDKASASVKTDHDSVDNRGFCVAMFSCCCPAGAPAEEVETEDDLEREGRPLPEFKVSEYPFEYDESRAPALMTRAANDSDGYTENPLRR
jgi:hypothetical protein